MMPVGSAIAVLCLLSLHGCLARIRIIGHRGNGCSTVGCAAADPENSMVAFHRALENGANGIELDVWQTADNQIVVIHGGEGKGERGDISETVSKSDGKIESNSYRDAISFMKLRKPWSAVERDYKNIHYSDLTRDQKDEVRRTYRRTTDYGELPTESKVPLFANVMRELCPDMLKKDQSFQVELKGTKKTVGKHVLLIAKSYPGCISTITSMQWAPHDSCSDEDAKESSNRCPNGRVKYDLLKPLVKDEDRKALGIDLGLLFNGLDRSLPKPTAITDYLRKYHAKSAHIRYDFYNSKKGGENYQELESEMGVVTRELHDSGFKVEAWFPGHHIDQERQYAKIVSFGLDGACVNNIPMLQDVIKTQEAAAQSPKTAPVAPTPAAQVVNAKPKDSSAPSKGSDMESSSLESLETAAEQAEQIEHDALAPKSSTSAEAKLTALPSVSAATATNKARPPTSTSVPVAQVAATPVAITTIAPDDEWVAKLKKLIQDGGEAKQTMITERSKLSSVDKGSFDKLISVVEGIAKPSDYDWEHGSTEMLRKFKHYASEGKWPSN